MGAGDIWALKQVHEEIIANIEDQEVRAKIQAQTHKTGQKMFINFT